MKKSLILAAAFAAFGLSQASADTWPSRTVTLINPYAAGGAADLIARTLAESLTRELGQPVVVDNRTGGSTAIAGKAVASAEADGHTLIIAGSPTFVIAPALNADAGYSGAEAFSYVSRVVNVPNILVTSAKGGLDSLEKIKEAALKEPEAISYSSVGPGSLPHMIGLMFADEIGASMLHMPYQGVAPAAVDLLAGNVDIGFMNATALVPHIRSGDLKALAIASTKRSPQLPDLPTMGELGFQDYEMGTWYGVAGPKGLPEAVVAKLDAALAKTMQDPEVLNRLTTAGVDPFYLPSADFAAFVASDAETVGGIIEKSGVRNAN